jgi:hypothetical protein
MNIGYVILTARGIETESGFDISVKVRVSAENARDKSAALSDPLVAAERKRLAKAFPTVAVVFE